MPRKDILLAILLYTIAFALIVVGLSIPVETCNRDYVAVGDCTCDLCCEAAHQLMIDADMESLEMDCND